jgi:hypothetical protein
MIIVYLVIKLRDNQVKKLKKKTRYFPSMTMNFFSIKKCEFSPVSYKKSGLKIGATRSYSFVQDRGSMRPINILLFRTKVRCDPFMLFCSVPSFDAIHSCYFVQSRGSMRSIHILLFRTKVRCDPLMFFYSRLRFDATYSCSFVQS